MAESKKYDLGITMRSKEESREAFDAKSLTEEIQEANNELYILITSTCEEGSEADDIVKSVEFNNGIEAWRLLRHRYDPLNEVVEDRRLDEAMDPSRCKSLLEVPKAIGEWEATLTRLRGHNLKIISDEGLRMRVIRKILPKELDEHLIKY